MLYSRHLIRKVLYVVTFIDALYILSFFMAPSLTPSTSFAEPATDLETHISISPSNTAVIDLFPGTFNSSSQTINVSTNNYTGYTLLFNTNTDTTDLVNTENNALTIPTITLNESAEPQTPESFTIGYGYSTDNTHYVPVPGFITDGSTQVAIADTINSSDHAGESSTELSFGAKVPVSTIAGDYQNSFQVTAITNDIGYTIEYKSNVENEVVSNLPENTIGTYNGSGVSAQLSQLVPSRYPYTFLGWSEDETLTQESILYQPGDSLLLEPTKNNSYTLYAQWEFRCHPDATTISHAQDTTITSDAICMQDMKLSVARSMVEEDQYTLYDVRDQKPYFISMLKDGNVWMTQNLDLGDAEKSYTLTSADTDLEEGQTFVLPTASGPDVISFDTSIYEAEEAYVVSSPVFRERGDKYYVSQQNAIQPLVYEDLESCAQDYDLDTCRHYHAGNNYNTYTATAGRVLDSRISSDTEAVSTSICPAGWRLSTTIDLFYPNSKSLYNLINNAYGAMYGNQTNSTTTAIKLGLAPFYYARAGYYSPGIIQQPNRSYQFINRLLNSAVSLYTNTRQWGEHLYEVSPNYNTSYYDRTSYPGYIEGSLRCIARDNSKFNLTINYHYQDEETPTRTEILLYDSEKPHHTHLYGDEPSRDGYIFLGWSTEPDSEEPVYQPSEPIYYSTKTIPTFDQSLDLYAIWEESPTNLLATISTMQEMTPEICDGTTTPSSNYGAPSAKLTDIRDGKSYWVAKLADGKCWMTQNLSLGDDKTTYILNSLNTDVAQTFTLPPEPNPQASTNIDIEFFNPTASNKYILPLNTLLSNTQACIDNYGNSAELCSHYKTGNYYNYYTATGGSGGEDRGSDNSPASICPVGWTIPSETEARNLSSLMSQYDAPSAPSTKLYLRPLYYTGTGALTNYGTITLKNKNSASYWTRKVEGSAYARLMVPVNDYGIFPSNTTYYTNKTHSYPIRCIARDYQSFTLSFDNNGGTGSPAKITSTTTNTGHSTYDLPTTTPTRAGFVFAGWNTKADGTGITAQPGEPFSASGPSTIYATWQYTLSYDVNGGENAPETQIKAGGVTTSFEVDSIIPANGDKVFLGWSTNPEDSSTTYLAGSILTVDAPATTLYAIWEDNDRGLATISTMQEMTGSVCEATPIHYSKQLLDIRDNKKYWVSKLADGNCWMTQNLDLGSKDTSYTLTPDDSDVMTTFTLPQEDKSKLFYYDNMDTINFAISYDEYVTPSSNYYADQYTSLSACVENTQLDEETCRHYHTGTYYNWYTATAGTGTAELDQYSIASSSICPAGWRLPIGPTNASESYSEYSKLLSSEGITTENIENFPTFMNRSGYYGTITYDTYSGEGNKKYNFRSNYTFQGSITTSTAISAISAITFNYSNLSLTYTASIGKYTGKPIRCIARSNETYTLTYDGNGAETESVPISQTSAVTDKGHYVFTLNSSAPTRPEYTFAGWNTKADGSGDTYQPGENFLAHGSITLYATWLYNLNFDANGGENAPEAITTAGGTTYTFTIDDSTPTKEGAYFWGWALDPTSETGEYYPSSKFESTSPSTTLYAIWNDNEIPLSTITYMQEINSNICRETPNGYSKQLVDNRDGKDYWVTKLADGNCWMTQNLDLGDTKKDYLLTPTDSDVKEDFLLTKKDYSKTIDPNAIDIIKFNDGNIFIATDQLGAISQYDSIEECINKAGLDEKTCKHYHSGNQYNAFTATAGTSTIISYANSEASSSLCPTGWRLPTSYNNSSLNTKSFTNLISTAYGITNDYAGSTLLQRSPLYYPMVYSSGELHSPTVGSSGQYITATSYSSIYTRTFTFNSSSISTYTNSSKIAGLNVRCVARNTPVDYYITYNYQDNTTEPKTKTLSFDGETRSLMIDTEKPEREGYNFVGWGTEPNSTEPTYMPGDLFEDRYTNSNMPTEPQSLNLYAIWEESTNLLSTISTMQEMTPEICNGTTTPTTNFNAPSAQLTDTRDGKKYWVSKLADGKCWMTQNLDLGSQETAYTLTPEDSDVASNFELPTEPTTSFNSSNYNTINFRKSDLYTVTSRNTLSDYIYNTKAECDAIYGENNTFCQHYHDGGYYNWYTVTAGEGLQSTSTNYAKTNTSICPAGWRLPYGLTSSTTPSEFSTLLYAYNIIPSAYTGTSNAGFTTNGFNAIRTNPLYFTRSGYFKDAARTSVQTNAYYHTANSNNSQYLYSLYFISNNVQPNAKITKYNGFNARCVARETESYTLHYDANGGTNTPVSQTGSSYTGHITMTISSNLPTRTGYRLLGYSRDKHAETADYLPGESYTWADRNLRLYAVWEKDFTCHPSATTIGNIDSGEDIANETKAICMQDMNTSVAQSMTETEQYRLIDIRDNTTYFVARMKDGNVWMTQNLDLGNSTKSYTLTPADSDVKEDFVLPTTPSAAFSTANANIVNFRDPGDTFYISSGSTAADSVVDSVDACDALSNNLDRTNCYHYHAGNYYSWYTATAGEGTNQITYNYEQTDSSICPAGWRLPYGLTTATVSSEYPALLYAQDVISSISSGTSTIGYKSGGLNAARNTPLYLIRAGYYKDAAATATKTEGHYWTSSNQAAANSFIFQFYASNLRTNYSQGKHQGRSIRCIAKNTPVNYVVNYHQNDGTDTIDTETTPYTGTIQEFIIKSETPTREGYIFKGWDTDPNATEPSYFQGQSIERQTNSTMTTSDQSLDLYAIWEESPVNLLTTISTMQEMTPEICSGTTTPSSNYGAPSAKLTDTRDGKTYWVAKLADGKCWMTQNLDLGDKENTITLTPTDSDVASNFNLTPEDSTIQFTNLTYDEVNFRDRGNEYIIPNNNTSTDTDWFFYSKERCEETFDADYCAHYHVGNYYNWYTATAGTGTYNVGTTYTTVNSSICPAGWRLPEAGTLTTTGSDFATLLSHNITTTLYKGTSTAVYQTNGFNTIRNNSLYLPRAGYYVNNATSSRAAQGHYWTSTAGTHSNAFLLYFIQTAPTPNYSLNKYSGRSVRCVARDKETFTLTYNANGGENAPASQSTTATNVGHATFTLDSAAPTRADFTFVGWNTESNGTGTSYQPGDTYPASGSTTLYAIWSYTINYDANGGTNAPTSSTENDGTSHLFTISSTVPTKTNSTFLGWADDPTATTGTYYANSVISSTSPAITLYAIWGSSIALDSISTMQEMTSNICANTPTGYTKQLEDIRDRTLDENDTPVVGSGTKYYVSKLADGKCWMTQNLDFAPIAGHTYYGDDTDASHVPDTDIGYGTSDATNVWTPATVSTTDSLSTGNANKYIYRELGNRFYVSSNTSATDTSYTTRESCEEAHDSITCAHSHTGNHYNWYTAVAGSGIYGTGSGANYTSAQNSICPYGWRLPFGRTSSNNISEAADLVLSYNIVDNVPLNNNALPLSLVGLNQLRNSPLYFVRAGYFYNTRAVDNAGTRMIYWTSTNVSNANAYAFYSTESATITPNASLAKNQGFNIRCVAR